MGCLFVTEVFFLLLLSYKCSLYILATSPLLNIGFTKMFFPLNWVFHFLVFLILMTFLFFFFFFFFSKHEPPSHLPPHNIFLGHPHAPAPSMLHPASDIDWRTFLLSIFFLRVLYFISYVFDPFCVNFCMWYDVDIC